MHATEAFTGGFTQQVFGAQAVFRTVMDGLARPGGVGVTQTQVQAPAPLGTAAASILLALCDFETMIWLSPALENSAARGWISFHTGAPLTGEPQKAAFAFAASTADLPSLSVFAPGNDEYPDTSTTLVLEVTALEGGPALHLEGPGINGAAAIAPLGMPERFIDAWAENRALFPCGIDLILTSGVRFICLPRTTRVQEA